MIISSVFEVYSLSATQLAELLAEGVGKVYSVNIVARKLPEDGKRVLWISRTCDIEVGAYTEKYHRVELLSNLTFGEDSLLRSVSAFHFWIEVENPEVYSHRRDKIKTSAIHHKDPMVLKVREAFFDLFNRMMQYIGPYNEPAENRRLLLVDHNSEYHMGYYHKFADKPAIVTLCDTDLSLPVTDFSMWADLQLEEVADLLQLSRRDSAI